MAAYMEIDAHSVYDMVSLFNYLGLVTQRHFRLKINLRPTQASLRDYIE